MFKRQNPIEKKKNLPLIALAIKGLSAGAMAQVISVVLRVSIQTKVRYNDLVKRGY